MSDQYPRPHGVQEHRFKPITFTGGYCPGRTYRVELVEVQKADLGRKYAKKDKRPLDPPPVICCGYFEVVPSGPGGKVQERKVDPELAALGAVCHVDLFPIQLTYKGGLADVHSQSMSTTPVPVPVPATLHNGRWITPACSPEMARSTLSGSYAALRPLGVREAEQSLMASSSEECLYHSATFVRDTFNESRAATLPSLRQLAPIIGYPPTYGAPYAQVAVAPLPHTYEDTDTVAYFGDFPIQESSICTNALSGSTFTQSSVIDYNGEKVITFVFSDLSVKMEGTFVLRYRTFNLFSQCPGPTPHPILAECFGGPFEIYSTKAFPGLRPSTELTRHISLCGVRVNMRENERKRPKNAGGAVGCISRTNAARARSGPTSSGPRRACTPTVASHSREGPPEPPGGSGSSPVSASIRAAYMNQKFAHWTAHVPSHDGGLGRSQRIGARALENNDGQDVDESRAHVQLYGGH